VGVEEKGARVACVGSKWENQYAQEIGFNVPPAVQESSRSNGGSEENVKHSKKKGTAHTSSVVVDRLYNWGIKEQFARMQKKPDRS